MKVVYATKRVEKKFTKYLQGTEFSDKIKQRIVELKAAPNLTVIDKMKFLELHKLRGEKKGLMSIKVKKNWKIIFRARDSFDNYAEVKTLELIDFEDYH